MSAGAPPNLIVAPDARIGENVHLGANVTIHARTVIGDGSRIEDNVVLGKVPRLAAHSTAPRELGAPLTLGESVTVCAGAIVFAGTTVAAGAIIGDQAYVRERTSIGAGMVIGRGSAVDNDVEIGARVRVQTGVYLTAYSLVEDDVFIGPGALSTNDNTMARHGDEQVTEGARLRRACRIGAGSILLPGVEIGEEAFVAAGAVVTRDVAARAVVVGSPARVTREVSDADLLERWR